MIAAHTFGGGGSGRLLAAEARRAVMFTNHPKAAALGAFLAGGVLVGGVTFAGVAHGVGTASTSTGQSDAQYTAKHAWDQVVNGTTTLSIPAGSRLTITFVGGGGASCTVITVVNGITVSYAVTSQTDGSNPDVFAPLYADSATVSCSGGVAEFVGYLTPIPAG
jgi:hypothetical protein